LIRNENSTDVFRKSISEHYKNRPKSMFNVCLAEFAGNYNYVSNERHAKDKNKDKLNLFGEDDDDLDDLDDDLFEETLSDPIVNLFNITQANAS